MRKLFLTLLLLCTLPAHAGLKEGISALDGGKGKIALKELQPLAQKGNTDAQYAMGRLFYSNVPGISADDKTAAIWFRRAAEQGHAEAQNMLGTLFTSGRGVPQNMIVAYALQALAVENGSTLAGPNLVVKQRTMTVMDLMTARDLADEMAKPGRLSAILDRYSAPR